MNNKAKNAANPGLRPAKRNAGRRPLDEEGKVRSAERAAIRRQRKMDKQLTGRKAQRSAEACRKRTVTESYRERKRIAALQQEADQARANRSAAGEDLSDKYKVLFTDHEGTHIKVEGKTELVVKPGRDINEAVSRFLNRKRIIL